MYVLVYKNQGDNATDRLKEAIETTVPWECVEEYHTIENLSTRLRRPLAGRAIVILSARNFEVLMALRSICDLLSDIPLILIVSDRERKTISAAHTLRPRFLTFADGDYTDVAAVLGKILERIQSRSEGQDKDRE